MLTHGLRVLEDEQVASLAAYARELSKVHTIIVATEVANVAKLKEAVQKNDSIDRNQITVIGLRAAWMIRMFKSLSSYLYMLFSNIWLARQLKQANLSVDVAEVYSFSRFPVAHFLWHLGVPVIWTRFKGMERTRVKGVEAFFEGAVYLRYKASWFLKSIRFHIDPLLVYALYKTDHVVFRQGTSLSPLLMDEKSCSSSLGFRWSTAKYNISRCETSKSIDFVCPIDYDTPSGLSIILKAFSQLVDSSSPTRRSLLNLILVTRTAREPRIIALINALNLNEHIKWLAHPTEEELHKTYKRAFSYVRLYGAGSDQGVMDALAYGLPIIVADGSISSEMVGGAALGVQIDSIPMSVENLKVSMQNLVVDVDERSKYSMLSRSRYLNHFQNTQFIRQRMMLLEEIYRRYNYSCLIANEGGKIFDIRQLAFDRMP